jgi:hypothetical protein
MNREPVTIMLAPIHADLLRRFIGDCFDDTKHPGLVLDFDSQALTKIMLEDVARQIKDDLTRPCVECTRKKLTDGTWGGPRREALALLTSMEPSDERWVRQDIKTQQVSKGADPTVSYELVCGHWVIDL